jgi:PBP1b-binding outer membrane lipoprotein LpoB
MTMRKTILTVFAAALFAASASQNVAAAERHHVRKTEPVTTSEQFRNANNSAAAPVQSAWTYGGYSAPAGR